MEEYTWQDFTIEVFDDNTYTHNSNDNASTYQYHYFNDKDDEYKPAAQHGVKVFKDGVEISSCILIGSGGATGVYGNSAVVHNGQLAVCCCNNVFCLAIPTLQLWWQIQADWATCFKIYLIENDYLVHGELTISRITTAGEIVWQFSGADIFVSMDGMVDECVLNSDNIVLTDFIGNRYFLDYDGKLVG